MDVKNNQLLTYIQRHVELNEEEQSMVLSKFVLKQYKKNDFIGKQDEVSRIQSFILSGGARMFMLDDSGMEHIVQFAIEDWWVGDLGSFISQKPADFSVQCFQDTEVYQLSTDNLQVLYTTVPKMERFYRIIIQNAYVSAQKRIVNKTMLPAKERYLNFREKYPEIEQRVPQYMIASYLGITKEFLSKLRSQLNQKND